MTDAEVEQAYRREHEQAAVRYVALPASLFEAQVTMTDEELQAYYEAHKEGYREPEQRQIRNRTKEEPAESNRRLVMFEGPAQEHRLYPRQTLRTLSADRAVDQWRDQ